MFFGQDISQIAFVFMVAVAVGGMALAIFFPFFTKRRRQSEFRQLRRQPRCR